MKNEMKRYSDAEFNFFKIISKASLTLENESVLISYTAVDSEDLNLILQRGSLQNLKYVFDSATKFFTENRCSAWSWLIKEDLITDEFLAYATQCGYMETDNATAMVCDLGEQIELSKSDNLTINKCNDDLALWAQPLEKAFESSQKIMAQYTAAHQRSPAVNRILKHYVGLIGGQPVSALTVSSCDNKTIRLDDVGTDPDFQGKGYATQIIQYALLEAKRLGAEACYLCASSQGLTVYEKIGFKPLFNIRIFVKI